MKTGSAFNALLKTLEEPPAHVIFILATTELHKLPATIVSRCQRIDFRRISSEVLSRRLLHIAGHEGIELTEGGARLLSRLAVGGMRDAISLFELCAGMKERIDEALVASVCGAGDRMAGYALVEAIAARAYDTIYATVRDLVMSSRDLTVFWKDLIDCYRDMMVIKTAGNAAEYLDLTDAELARLREIAARFSQEQLIFHSRVLEDAYARMQRGGVARRATAELALTRLCDPRLSSGDEALLARLTDIENKLALLRTSGAVSPAAASTEGSEASSAATVPSASARSEAQPPPSEPTAVPAAESRPEDAYRPFVGWREVVEEVGQLAPALAGPLGGSRAAISGIGHLVVSVGNPFFLTLLSRDEARATIRATAERVGETTVVSVEIRNSNAKNGSNSILGELERALAECN